MVWNFKLLINFVWAFPIYIALPFCGAREYTGTSIVVLLGRGQTHKLQPRNALTLVHKTIRNVLQNESLPTFCVSSKNVWRPELNEVCSSWADLVTSGCSVCRFVAVSCHLFAIDCRREEIAPCWEEACKTRPMSAAGYKQPCKMAVCRSKQL
jgi:hypothetical protein